MHLNFKGNTFFRNRISQLKLTISRRTNVETLIHKNSNIVKKQFNFIAETVDYKQL